jgi:hypothetical protein
MKKEFSITVNGIIYILRDLTLDEVEKVQELLSGIDDNGSNIVMKFSNNTIKGILKIVLCRMDGSEIEAGNFTEMQAAEVLAAFLKSRTQLSLNISQKFTASMAG